jgi:hypothetical protein
MIFHSSASSVPGWVSGVLKIKLKMGIKAEGCVYSRNFNFTDLAFSKSKIGDPDHQLILGF